MNVDIQKLAHIFPYTQMSLFPEPSGIIGQAVPDLYQLVTAVEQITPKLSAFLHNSYVAITYASVAAQVD